MLATIPLLACVVAWALFSAHRARELKRLDQLRSEFLSTVSHELRTPLTSMLGYTKLMLDGEDGALASKHREYLGIVHSSMLRMNQLINDLLDVERMDRGEMKMTVADVDPLDVLVYCRELMAVMARDRGLEFRFDVPDDLPWVRGDRARLIQVFTNLISNALKYTPTGFVSVTARADAGGVRVDIADSGYGISVEEQEHLFKKFYRTESAKLAPESGTGLGLTIIRGLIQAHQGRLTLVSERGKGSTFTVWLPAAPARASA